MRKWKFAASVFQLVIGVLGVAAFIVLAINNESMTRWIVTLVLAIAFAVLGVIGIVDSRKGDT